MKSTRLACLAILTSALLGSSTLAQVPTQKIKVLTLLGRPVQFAVAEKQGLFSEYGIEVETANKGNSEELRADLAAGRGDLAYLAVDNAVAMVELTDQDVVIVMGGEGSQNELIAQPEIKSVKDLRGKMLIVDAPNTAYALQMKKILLLGGMQAGKDYEMKPFGATPQRLIAMREHKDYAGSMLGPPSSLVAKSEGFVSLGSVQELIGPYQAAGFFTLRKWAQGHRDALLPFLAAIIEAQRWITAPANKQQVIDLWTKEYHLAPEVAAENYETTITRPGGFARDARFDLEGFKNVLKLRAEVEGQWGGHPPPPEKYYDPSFYVEALAKLKSSE
ncbi:MAG TPA: ABC transporter substrate-binding protein [Candidatus Udaeobacter sp.]|jgi:ABC-type nitrate/sulfonate/bicarbonate transport system substrate-binding protein|nr:ABC transporter substrate-binding protein [Candidatus Udaeobacter sp.]